LKVIARRFLPKQSENPASFEQIACPPLYGLGWQARFVAEFTPPKAGLLAMTSKGFWGSPLTFRYNRDSTGVNWTYFRRRSFLLETKSPELSLQKYTPLARPVASNRTV